MERVELGQGLDISRIVYGKWRLTDDADTSVGHIQAKMEACLEQGITTFDQADIYGGYMAEEVLGTCLKAAPGLRDQIEIITKCDIVAPVGRYADARVKHYDTSRAHILGSVDNSLELMGIDQIDLLLIHRPDPFMNPQETAGALEDVIKAGKVRSVGVSNFKHWDWTLLQSALSVPLITNQIEISLAEISPFSNGDIAYLQERGIKPMAWSPLGGGALMSDSKENGPLRARMAEIATAYGVDHAAVAIAWLIAHPAKIIPVMGTNNISRIRGFSDALKVEMDRQTWFELYTHALGHEVA